MYCYEVGYDSYEEAPITVLTHEKEYTQDQFDELVADCAIKVYELNSNKPKEEKYEFEQNFDHLLDGIIKILKDDFGFKDLVVQATFRPFGWASILDEEDWGEATKHDKQLNLIRKKIKDGNKN